jgi:hypothetical protein
MLFKKYLFFYVEDDEVKISLKTGFDKDSVGKLLNVKDDWQPLGNNLDNLYFFPGCAVPRFKVRENYSCTIKPDKATAAFVSANQIKEGSVVSVIPGVAYMSKTDASQYVTSNFGRHQKERLRFEMLMDQVEPDILIDKSIWYNQFYYIQNNVMYPFNDLVNIGRWELKNGAESFYEVRPDSGIHNLNCDIYWETAVLKHLNENQVTIDEKRYEELRLFGLSEDKENTVLMMEIMSNSDFEKSFVHLLFLLKEFGNKIYPLKEANHVNFKSLLTYFDISVKQLDDITLVDLTRALRKHKKFTRSNVQRITSLCAEETYLGDDAAITGMYTAGQVLRPDLDNLLDN